MSLWRIDVFPVHSTCRSCMGSTLQLVERSMHNNLVGGAVRLHLPSQCLPRVQVHELGERHVLVACASTESVYCFLLPHPVALWQVRPLSSSLQGADVLLLCLPPTAQAGSARGEGRPSVLQCLTQDGLSRMMLAQPIFGQRVLCTSVANSNQVLFSLPSKSGSILVVQMPLQAEGQWALLTAQHPPTKCWSLPPPAGAGFQFEHHLSGVMQRLWSGFTRTGDTPQGEGLVLHASQHSVTMALVTSELKLQCWGIKVCAHALLSYPSPPTAPPLPLAEPTGTPRVDSVPRTLQPQPYTAAAGQGGQRGRSCHQ